MSSTILARISELQKEVAEKTDKLRRSLQIQSLVPDAFAHGACRSYFRGVTTDLNRLDLVIERGDKSQVVFPFLSLPEELRLWYLPEIERNPRLHYAYLALIRKEALSNVNS